MLNGTIFVSAVDYEATLAALYPLLAKELASSNSRSAVVRLFRELDDAALPVARALLRRLPEEIKAELAVSALNAAAPALRAALLALLAEKGLAGGVEIGALAAEADGTGLRLFVRQVNVDYGALLKSTSLNALLTRHFGALAGLFNRAGKMAVLLAPSAVEKLLLDFALQPGNKQTALAVAQKLLARLGVFLTLADVRIERADAEETPREDAPPFTLSPGQEQALLRAAADCLRDAVAAE